MIVGLDGDDESNNEKQKQINKELESSKIKADDVELWRKYYDGNKDELLTYGTGDAQIFDYGVFDLDNNIQTAINNEEEYIIKMKVKFNKNIDEPIFAMSFKDVKGLELAGVNTKVYKTKTGNYKKGDIVTVEFKQSVPLNPERYTISFGCTKFKKNGELEVFDRKYDAIFLEVLGYRGCLGLLDLKTKIDIKTDK